MVVLHQFKEFGGRFAAMGEVVSEVDERKCRNGNEICQTTKGAEAGLFDGESAFEVLEEVFDLPAVVVGVGSIGGRGLATVAIVGKGHARRAIRVGNRRHIAIEIVGVGRDDPARVGPCGHLPQVRQRVGDSAPVGIGLRDDGPGRLIVDPGRHIARLGRVIAECLHRYLLPKGIITVLHRIDGPALGDLLPARVIAIVYHIPQRVGDRRQPPPNPPLTPPLPPPRDTLKKIGPTSPRGRP